MLNELYELSQSLESAGIATEEWHKDFKEIKKTREPKATANRVGESANQKTGKTKQALGTPAYVVYINHEGDITEVEQVGQVRLDGVRYWQMGNGVSFPCFNVRPLFKAYKGTAATVDEQEIFNKWIKSVVKSGKFSEQDEEVLRSYRLLENELWDDSQNKRISKCLVNVPTKLLELVGQPPDDYKAVEEIINRSVKMTPQKLFTQLTSQIIEQIHRVPSNVEDLLRFLLYVGTTAPSNSILVALELNDGLSKFKNPALNRKTLAWINKQLLFSDTKRHAAKTQRSNDKDAFGLPVAGWDEKYGGLRKIGIFDDVILRAMSKESPCQYRYRAADFNSFIAGAELRKRAKGALKWLTAPERKDMTWGNVSFTRDDNEILLVYPSEMPKVPVAAVAMFGGAATNAATQSARFVDYAKDVTKALHTISRPLKEVEMRVFALRKMDKGRTQVSCNRQYSAERLINAATEWQTSCGNVPAIEIRQWGEEKGTKELHSLEVPFPLEVVWCLNTSWPKAVDDVKKIQRVREFSSSDGITLLLDEGVRLKPLLERALHAVIRNGGNLLIATAHTQHHGGVHKVNGKYDKQKLLLPTILGLLLAKLEWKKGDYMKTAPYLIGRMLSLADQIHYHYCQHVRKGSTPSQLIGNALMATALEEPEKALALYAQRILPYQAWARTAKGDEGKLAGWFLSELGKVCSDVALANVPNRCADADKAQMMLGYLAKNES
ncbi:MAG: hypothetical protein ACOY9D_11205 [Pseudomonadota bacterium]